MAWVLAACPAGGADDSRLEKLQLYPTFASVSIYLQYSGDDNKNARAFPEYRRAGHAAWQAGHPLVRIDQPKLGGRMWTGSLMFLEEGATYEVRTKIADPDGAGAPVTGKVTTRRSPRPHRGPEVWVAPHGSNANAGTRDAPLRSIQAAVDRAGPGTVVRVAPGTYHESVQITRSGTPQAPITIAGVLDAEGRPAAKIYGSDQKIARRGGWKDEGGGVWSIQAPAMTENVGVDAQRLYWFRSLDEVKTQIGTRRGKTFKITTGGFYQDKKNRVYVVLPDGGDPNKRAVHVAVRRSAVAVMGASHVVVTGLEVAYTNTFGLEITSGSNNWVHAVRSHTFGKRGIAVRRLDAHNNLVERCEVSDYPVHTWPWSASKGAKSEDSAISVRAGRGNVIRYNLCWSLFNGIDPCSWRSDFRMTIDCDVHDNVVRQIGDDAFEPDGHGINQRFWNNRVEDVYMGFSLAPIDVGPCYLVRNVIVNNSRWGVKAHNSMNGHVFFYHNSIYTTRPDTRAWNSDPACGNLLARNNVLYATFHYNVVSKQGSLGPNDLDYNDYWSPDGTAGAWWNKKKYRSWAALRKGTGFEKHGLNVDPAYRDAAQGDLRLKPASPLRDRGAAIPGINDLVTDGKPDIGAYEIGQPMLGPRADRAGLGAPAEQVPLTREGGPAHRTVPTRTAPDEAALAAAREAVQAAATKAIPGFRQRIIKGVQGGRREVVYVELGGALTRGRIFSADDTQLIVRLAGGEVPIAWRSLSPRRFAAIAAKYAGQTPRERIELAALYAAAGRLEAASEVLGTLAAVGEAWKPLAEHIRRLARARQ